MARAEEFQQVTPAALFWQAYDPRVKTELSASAIVTGAGLLLVDPIPLAAEALAELTALAPPHAIVLTNGNHWRAAAEYREQFGVPVWAHAEAAEDGTPDRLLRAGEWLAGEVEVLELPGAGPGEIALRHAAGALHVGDALVQVEPLGFAVLPEKYCLDPRRLRESLRNLLQVEFRAILFAHGTPLVTDAHSRLAQLLA